MSPRPTDEADAALASGAGADELDGYGPPHAISGNGSASPSGYPLAPLIGGGSPAHFAMPRLLGAPAYARPPRPLPPVERPFDPDDLPLEAFRTDEERNLLSEATRRRSEAEAGQRGQVLRPSNQGGIRSLATRLLRVIE